MTYPTYHRLVTDQLTKTFGDLEALGLPFIIDERIWLEHHYQTPYHVTVELLTQRIEETLAA